MLSSTPVAWLNCAKMATGKDCAKHEIPRSKIHRRGTFKHSLDGPFGWGHAGWLVGHWRPPSSQQMSAQHLNNKMTRNPPLPQEFQKSVETTEKVCAHVANPCYHDKTVEDVIARKSCPLQWDPLAEKASF